MSESDEHSGKKEGAWLRFIPDDFENAAKSSRGDSASAGESSKVAKDEVQEKESHFCRDSNVCHDPCDAQWLMMYSTAAYVDEVPNERVQRALTDFYSFLPDQCRSGEAAYCFDETRKLMPPTVSSRKDLMMWICNAENFCRAKAGLPQVRCRCFVCKKKVEALEKLAIDKRIEIILRTQDNLQIESL